MARKAQQPTDNNVVNLITETPVSTGLSVINPIALAINTLPDLSAAIEEPIELGYLYWTPVNIGEYKRGVVIGIENSYYDKVDDKTGEITELNLPCLIFAEQRPDGTWIKISNGSKRLVAVIEQCLKTGSIIAGQTPIQIKYMGKKKNSTNGFSSDTFEVKPLLFKAA
jgi:hypothetical protein